MRNIEQKIRTILQGADKPKTALEIKRDLNEEHYYGVSVSELTPRIQRLILCGEITKTTTHSPHRYIYIGMTENQKTK